MANTSPTVVLTGTEKPPEQGRRSAGEPSEVALGDYVTTREVRPVNVGELTYIAVAYARNHQVPITRRQCRTMATEAMRRMDAEHERLEEIRLVTPLAAHRPSHSDPTGEAAIRHVQNLVDQLAAA